MLNRIIVMGRLTRDPELRYTQSQIPVCSFSVACDRDYGQDGEHETDFIDVVAWRSTAEFVSKYFAKGRMAVVDGRLQLRDWTDRDGNKRRSAEVVADSVYFGDSKPKEENAAQSGHGNGRSGRNASGNGSNGRYASGNSARGRNTSGRGQSDGFDGFEIPDGFDPGFGA